MSDLGPIRQPLSTKSPVKLRESPRTIPRWFLDLLCIRPHLCRDKVGGIAFPEQAGRPGERSRRSQPGTCRGLDQTTGLRAYSNSLLFGTPMSMNIQKPHSSRDRTEQIEGLERVTERRGLPSVWYPRKSGTGHVGRIQFAKFMYKYPHPKRILC